MTYNLRQQSRTLPKWFKWVGVSLLVLVIVGAIVGFVGSRYLDSRLKPVSRNTATKSITITSGMSTSEIGNLLVDEELIQSKWAFRWYVRIHNAAQYLQAGTYAISPSQSTQEIVGQLTHGKVATELVTIPPGLRLDQVKAALIKQGYTPEEVDGALEPTQYESMAALADKPTGNNLEGYLYPDSFQRTADTELTTIIQQSLLQMDRRLTTDIRKGFAAQGLSVYQGIILASIVEQEVPSQTDRQQAAQVFIKRLQENIPLGSDAANFYGSELAGLGKDITYDSPYNTRLHSGLPPTPIGNVSASSLEAVAHPANTDWLFFVSGDDGTTHFSRTQAEHEALTKQYCTKLCQ